VRRALLQAAVRTRGPPPVNRDLYT